MKTNSTYTPSGDFTNALKQTAPNGPDPVFYDGTAYYRRSNDGTFTRLMREDLVLHLVQRYNLSEKGGNTSQAKTLLHHIQTNNLVGYAGPMCGRSAGPIQLNQTRALVTHSPAFIEGKEGKWPTIGALVSNLLGAAAKDPYASHQLLTFFGWLKHGRTAMRNPDNHTPGQALLLVGPPGCGKSLLQANIITPAIGGRQTDPSLFLTKGTTFNADLWHAEHLCVADEAMQGNATIREAMRDRLKALVANPEHLLHAKGKTAITARAIWRVTLSANDDAESATNLPTLEASFADKVIYLKCYAPPSQFFDENDPSARTRFAQALKDELPALLYAIDNLSLTSAEGAEGVKTNINDARWGVKAWHHPDIVDLLGQTDPLNAIADVIEQWISQWEEQSPVWEGSSVTLYSVLDKSQGYTLKNRGISSGANHLGHQLSKLRQQADWGKIINKVKRREGGRKVNRKKEVWVITKPTE